jgi:uncharacterized protein YndB with AHSA1/START domain
MNDTSAVKVAESGAGGIKIVRVFEAPRQLVWNAWTQPAQFAQWFGEHGSSVPLESASMDVRPGGEWSVIMLHGPDKIELPFAGEFVELDEPERLVMTLKDPMGDGSPNRETWTIVLTDLGDGRTEMDFRHTGGNLPEDEYARAMAGTLIFFERMASLVEREAAKS